MAVVNVGIYLDMRNPPEWRRPWAELYGSSLELIQDAERYGVGGVWLSEHHFFEDGYLTQPLAFAAAVAARTKRVRIGTAVLLAALRHPLHIAEEAIVVDLVSGGRVELAFGAGYRVPEYEAFGADISRRYGLTDAALVAVRDHLASAMLPPPVQQPIPLWLGYQGPQGALRAGRLGVGLLTLQRALLEPYQQGLREGGWAETSARMGGVIDIVLADDPPAAFERILPYYAYQLNSYRRYGVEGTGRPVPREITVEKIREDASARGVLPGLRVMSAADAITALRQETKDLPVTDVYSWASIAGMPGDLVQRHVELLGTEVAPALAG